MNPYAIQQWLFDEAMGVFEIDLGESGIQYHHVTDLQIDPTWDLNYSRDRGDDQLRSIVSSLYNKNDNEVLIAHGGQEALYLLYNSLLQPGDHVITFTPGWQQSWEVPEKLGAKVDRIALNSAADYRIDWGELESLICGQTKLIILNYPNNPTGKNLEEDDWQELAEIVDKHEFYVINDEEYVQDFAKSIVNRVNRSFSVSGLSKVFGFPGLRVGWLIGDPDVIEKAVNYKRYLSVCNSIVCERLAVQVLQKRPLFLEEYRNLTEKGLHVLGQWIDQQELLELIPPQGTPYAYVKYLGEDSTMSFCRRLLNEEAVLVMPAEVFEDKKAFRLTFGRTLDVLRPGLEKISTVLTKLK